MRRATMVRAAGIVAMVAAWAGTAAAADWPQWGGPDRTAISAETGLLKQWPAGGPKLAWSVQGLGRGFSSPSVAEGRLYVTGSTPGNQEVLFAYGLDGKPGWRTEYGPMWTRNYESARTSPTVVDGRIYVVSSLGRVVCLAADSGAIVWAVDMKERFGAADPTWGITESPLVVGQTVICTPGGAGALMAALDTATGKTVWKTEGLREKSAYCSPLAFKMGRRALAVTMTEQHVVGVDLATGKLLWSVPYRNKWAAHANTPVLWNGHVYVTSGYDEGGMLLKLSADGSAATKVWEDKVLDVHHGGVVALDGHVYGASWRGNGDGAWVCLNLKTGKPTYETNWKCKGSVVAAEGMLYCYEEKSGHVALVPATPDGFKPVSEFKVEQGNGQHWAHPVIANGRLYIRHGDALMAYDIKAN